MQIPSRRMPEREIEETIGWFGVGCIAIFILGMSFLIGWAAWLIVAIFVVGGLISWRRDVWYAKTREGESICEFARSFDYRNIDTWVIRAVYEEFSDDFPVRASDSFENDIRMDGDDYNDRLEAIATRIGRDTKHTEENPMYDKIHTIGDLVMFFNYAPKLERPASGVTT